MRVLALDVATKTGWCVLSDASGTWEIDGIGTIDVSPEKDEPEGVRYWRFRDELRGVLDLYGDPDAVALEQPFSRSMRAAQVMAGLTAVALVELEASDLSYVFVSPGVWKKHVTGNGAVKKPGVRAALNGWAGIDPGSVITLDESDALGIGKWLIDCALVEREGAA